MIDLRPCPACRRHVGVDEAACPFCAAPIAAAPGPTGRRAAGGRLTRAAIFAGAVAAAGACGSSEPKAEDPQGGDLQQESVEGRDDAGAAGEVMLSSPADAAVVPEPDPDEERRLDRVYDSNNIPMPYGAPPARNRLV